MLVEIPDPEVILAVIVAFVVGLGGLYGFYKLRPYFKTNSQASHAAQTERLEYYERQLIDMKIRLDALEIQGIGQKDGESSLEIKGLLEKLAKNETGEKTTPQSVQEEVKRVESVPSLDYNDVTEHVLHLITDKAMTSRDIQTTLKKSREHTSRLMKKLFEDGYVERNTNSKPYTYAITEKGKQRIGMLQTGPTIA